jgi:hypothetical protein
MRFEVPKEMKISVLVVSRVVMPCGSVDRYQYFKCQFSIFKAEDKSSNIWSQSASAHSVTTQKTNINKYIQHIQQSTVLHFATVSCRWQLTKIKIFC